MTTIAQARNAARPVLQRNSDLALVGRMLVVKPVRHILRGINIGRSGDPTTFVPTWAVVFLFEPRQTLSYNWGQRLYSKAHGPWDVANPNTPMVLAEEIEREALPLLRPIETVDDFVAFVSKERFPHTHLDLYELRKIYVDVARGDLASARAICAYLATENARRKHSYLMQEEYDRIMQNICPLLAADDRAGLARFLHDCEAGSVKRMKLDKYWEPSSFPIETQRTEG